MIRYFDNTESNNVLKLNLKNLITIIVQKKTTKNRVIFLLTGKIERKQYRET